LLANGAKELKEVQNKLKIKQSGALSEYLEDLIKSGFVERDYTWHISSGKVSILSHFRLSDNYLRFYLKYIEPNLSAIMSNEFETTTLSTLPNWNAIVGLQFENLVLKNRSYIKQALGLKQEDIRSNNPFFQRKTERIPGCQIDYLIQMRSNLLYLCEFKFSQKPIGSEVIDEVKQKIDRLVYPKHYTVLPVLVHVNGIHEETQGRRFFSHIIDFGKLLAPIA
jgi:hypothetical protein